MTTGEKIKTIRIKREMSQAELAEIIGTTPQNISQYERGVRNPKDSTLYRIAEALEVDWLDLSDDEELEELDNELRRLGWIDGPATEAALKKVSLVNNEKSLVQSAQERLAANVDGVQIKMMKARVLAAFDRLNEAGQQEAVKRVEELTEIPRYQAQNAAQTPPEAPESAQGKD